MAGVAGLPALQPAARHRRAAMRHKLVGNLLIVPLLLVMAVRSSGSLTADFDYNAAELRLKDTAPLHRGSLHEAQQARDGTRGFGLPNPIATRAALAAPPPPPFATQLEWQTYYLYCGWDAIVRAINLDSVSVLTRDKSMIYTVSRFSVVDSIKSDATFTAESPLLVYRVGGEVADGNERLRIDTPDMAAFEPHHTYILLLQRDQGASTRQYWIAPALTITVRDDKVYPIAGQYAWMTGAQGFPSGTPYTEVKNTFARVSALKACARAQ
jgi:hypothetical protein